MSFRVHFSPSEIEIRVPAGTLLSSAAKNAGVFIDSPCGGNGTCGKCVVLLTRGDKQERVLACQTIIEQDSGSGTDIPEQFFAGDRNLRLITFHIFVTECEG